MTDFLILMILGGLLGYPLGALAEHASYYFKYYLTERPSKSWGFSVMLCATGYLIGMLVLILSVIVIILSWLSIDTYRDAQNTPFGDFFAGVLLGHLLGSYRAGKKIKEKSGMFLSWEQIKELRDYQEEKPPREDREVS